MDCWSFWLLEWWLPVACGGGGGGSDLCGSRRMRASAVCDGLSESAGSCDAVIEEPAIAATHDEELEPTSAAAASRFCAPLAFGRNDSRPRVEPVICNCGGTLSAASELLFAAAVTEPQRECECERACGRGADGSGCSCSVALEYGTTCLFVPSAEVDAEAADGGAAAVDRADTDSELNAGFSNCGPPRPIGGTATCSSADMATDATAAAVEAGG